MRFQWYRFILFVLLQMWWGTTRRLWRYETIFLVYPGTDDDYKGYFPKQFRQFLPLVFPIGTVGRKVLVMATPTSTSEFESDPSRFKVVRDELLKIGSRLGVKSIALAGRLPGLMHRHGVALDPPFVYGDNGTVYACDSTIEAVIGELGLEAKELTVGVLGVGFIGGRLIRHWMTNGFKHVVGLDKVDHSEEFRHPKVTVSTDPAVLKDVDVLVVLTEEGEQIAAVIPHLKSACVILDDTHPQMPRVIRNQLKGLGFRCFKVAIENGLRFTPRLPGYHRSWLPGCLIEAVVVAGHGGFRVTDVHAFAEEAKRSRLLPIRVEHKAGL